MKLAITRCALFAALAMLVTSAGIAQAQIQPEPVPGYAGNIDAVPVGIDKTPAPSVPLALVTIYDNTASAANFGFASNDPAAVFGDELLTTGTGILSTHKLSIYNSSGSAGPLLTATVNVSFYNFTTSALLGSYNTNVNFGAGLNPGQFATITVTGIDPLLISLNVTDIAVLQTITAKTGTATSLGIASRNPPTIGSSPITMYINALTVGPAGFYTITSGGNTLPANPVNQVVINDTPVPVTKGTWGRIKQMYR